MTTMELIEKGIGHNCLSDAYDLGKVDGRIDAINQLIRVFEQRKAFYTQEEVLNILYFIKEKTDDNK